MNNTRERRINIDKINILLYKRTVHTSACGFKNKNWREICQVFLKTELSIIFKDIENKLKNTLGTKATIKNIYDKYSYVCDTHTAVAVKVYEDYRKATGDTTRTLIASTASPYKFSSSVLDAICPEAITEDEYAMVDKINELSKITIPESLADLKNKPVRFSGSVANTDMPEYVMNALNIK